MAEPRISDEREGYERVECQGCRREFVRFLGAPVLCRECCSQIGTHWEDCEKSHHGCALVKLEDARRALRVSEERVRVLEKVQTEAYKLAELMEDAHDMRMAGVDPASDQAKQLRSAVDRQVIATARAADTVHAALAASPAEGGADG